jgi:hypothetical protein
MKSQTLELRFKAFRLPSFLANYSEAGAKSTARWMEPPAVSGESG